VNRPWSVDHLLRVLGGNTIGALVIAIGWFEAATAGSADVPRRLTWLGVSMTGLAIAGLSNAVWTMRGRRVVAIARTAALHDVDALVRGESPTLTAIRGPAPVVVEGSNRYHRPDCLLVRGKPTRPAGKVRTATTPCEVCRPE
jgi:hypothetical protein